MDPNRHMTLKIGHTFDDVNQFRNVLKVYAIKKGFKLKRIKNEKVRVTYKCAWKNYKWRIHPSPTWDKLSFQIKTLKTEHICPRIIDNYEATSDWIAAHFLHLFKENPELSIKILAGELMRKYKVECHLMRLYRAKYKALKLLGVDQKSSFTKLSRYEATIMKTNPGSVIDLQSQWVPHLSTPNLKRFFVSFNAQRR